MGTGNDKRKKLNMSKKLLSLLCAILPCAAFAAPVMLKNDQLTVTISPEQGGCVTSMKSAKAGRELSNAGKEIQQAAKKLEDL